MIFSKLFRPKWQHKDAEVRLEAIRTLLVSDAEQKTQLHELAFNDSVTSVRLAALNKLDNFSIWWKLAQTDKDERVKKFALQKVEKQVLALKPEQLSMEERETFLRECTNNALLEKTVNQLHDDLSGELMEHLLSKLNKAQVTKSVFFKTQNVDLQKCLMNSFDDENSLNRVIKRVENEEIIGLATQALNELKYKKSRPIQLEKETRLILSKLLALKDISDFDKLKKSRDELDKIYGDLKVEFHFFSVNLLQEIESKYDDINVKLEKQIEGLSVVWKEQQLANELVQKLNEALAQAKGELQTVGQTISEQAATLTNDAINDLKGKLKHAAVNLQNVLMDLGGAPSQEQRKTAEDLFNQLSSTELTLSKLPDFQDAVKKGTEAVSKLKEAALPESYEDVTSAKQLFDAIKAEWRTLQQPYRASWPVELKEEWKSLENSWKTKIRYFNNEADQAIKSTRSMLKGINNLVNSGKYHGAMRLFEKAKVSFDELPEKPKAMLSRLYDDTTGSIENLKGWQSYLAQPRKPALIEEVKEIVEKPLSINDQAEKVKLLRKQWISLGVSDDENDQELNQQFDVLCEKAFEPCREHFAEQEKKRQENLDNKRALLTSFESLGKKVANDLPLADLAKQLKSLQSQWQSTGETDYQFRDEISQRYRTSCMPLKKRVNDFYKDNAEQKEKLLQRAEKLLAIEDLNEAAEQSKSLQEKWKAIGHAGYKQEKVLWTKFREFNNAVFAKKESVYLEQRAEEKAQVEAIENQLNALNTLIENSTDKAELLSQADAESQVIREKLTPLHPKAVSRLTTRLDKLLNKQQQKIKNWDQVSEKQSFITLFDLIGQWTRHEKPDALGKLPSRWQQCFNDLQSEPEDDERLRLTLMLEIIGDLDSPLDDAGLRKAVQLEMMATKLEDGQYQEKESLLRDWIKLGPLSDIEQPLLPRVKAVFI